MLPWANPFKCFFLPPSLIRFWIFSDLEQRNKTQWPYSSKREMSIQCCFNVGLASHTVIQHSATVIGIKTETICFLIFLDISSSF